LKLVPDIGGEVARAVDAFFQQASNQEVIEHLFARGVTITDTHAPSAKLQREWHLANLLVQVAGVFVESRLGKGRIALSQQLDSQ
jgi:DNA ligase (NAD+)